MKYEVALIDRSISGFTFIVGVSIHPKDNENDFLEMLNAKRT